MRQLHRSRVRIVHQFVPKADGLCLLGANVAAGEEQLKRARLADEPWQRIRQAVVRGETAPHEDRGEAGLRPEDSDIEGTGPRHAASGSDAVDRRDRRFIQTRHHHRNRVLTKPISALGSRWGSSVRVSRCEIRARAESTTVGRAEYCPHVIVSLKPGRQVEQLGARVGPEGVESIWAVDLDVRDAILHLDQQVLKSLVIHESLVSLS